MNWRYNVLLKTHYEKKFNSFVWLKILFVTILCSNEDIKIYRIPKYYKIKIMPIGKYDMTERK